MSQKKGNKKNPTEEVDREKQELKQMKKIDTTGLKEEIFQLRQQLGYLIHQKSSLESQMVKANDKYMKDSFEIEKTIKIQEEEMVDLQNNYKLLKNTFEENRKKNQTEWEKEESSAIRRRIMEKGNLSRKITELQKKVDYMKQFRKREEEYWEELKKLKEKEEHNQAQQKRDIQKIKEEHESKRKELKENVQHEIEVIKESQVNKIQQKMNKQQQIKRQNELIQEQIDLCQNQKAVLQEQYRKLLDGNENSQSMNTNSVLQGQANQTYERSLRVIKLQNKLNKLKIFMQEEIVRLEKECKNVENQSDNIVKQLQAKIGKAQSWLKLKDKDLKKIKACSQMVLNQRSNLEAYLLQVFHEHMQLDYKDPANLNQILRYLFIKINSKKPPTSYKDYLLSTQQSMLSKHSI